MDAHECLAELRRLEKRADELFELGNQSGPDSIDQAKAGYKVLKSHLAERVQDFQRERRGMGPEWWSSTFDSALRKAHIAMRAPTNTSPRSSAWQTSVLEMSHELRYYAHSLEKGLKL